MRVAFVSEYPASPDDVVGGVQAVVRRLAVEMARRSGFDVHAVSVERGLAKPSRERQEGVTVHRYPATARFGNLTLGRAERRTTARALRDIAPDVAHAHVLGPPALGAADSGVPWVATAHGMQEAEGRTGSGWIQGVRSAATVRMERMSLARCRHLIVISPYVRDYFRGRLAGVATHAIENPLEERFFRIDGEHDPRTVLFAGRLIPRKDVETLLGAAAILHRDGVSFRLRIAGGADDPLYRAALQDRAREAAAGAVSFLGALPPSRMEEELAGAGVFVQSSRQETASVAVMEAMAAGLAVVATDVGGTRHLLEDPRQGALVPARDPAALAAGLRVFLESAGKVRAAGERNREVARHRFRVEEVVDRTLEVYGEARGAVSAPVSLQSTGSAGRN